MADLRNTVINDTGYLNLPSLQDGGATNIYELGGVTLQSSARGLGVSRNNLQLYIDPAGNAWQQYQNLPAYLQGLVTTLNINDGNIALTFDAEATVYLLRIDNWSAVDTSGWTQIVDNYQHESLMTGYGTNWDIFRRVFPAGTYSFDNNSAMYLISLGEEGEIRYNEGLNALQFYHKRNPSDPGQWETMGTPFFSRQIINTNYTIGGYKSGVAWSNANRTLMATDTSTNLGDGKIRNFNYQAGANNRDNMFIFGAGGGHVVSSNYVSSFSMRTENIRTHQNKWDLDYSDVRQGAMWEDIRYAFSLQGGRIQEFNMITEEASTVLANVSAGDSWAMSHENIGIYWTGYTGATSSTFTFSTRTSSTRGGTSASHSHQQKTVNSKWTYQYAGNEGGYNGGNNLRRTDMYTNTTSGTVGKPVTNSGEENFSMGQNHQYMLGMYNGLQNNISWRFNYATESGFQGGSTLEPKGHDGMSSGLCGWRD